MAPNMAQACPQPDPAATTLPVDWIESARVDRESFAALYDAHYPRVFNYVMRTVLDVDAAEDIVSDTFLKALRSIDSFSHHRASFSTWLYRIATNTTLDYFRRRPRERQLPEAEPARDRLLAKLAPRGLDAREAAQRLEDYESLHRAIQRIKPKYRVAVTLFYFEEKTIKEIASIIECTVVTVKWRLHQARKLLARELKDQPLPSVRGRQ